MLDRPSSQRCWIPFAAVVVAVGLCLAGAPANAQTEAATAVEFTRDVLPIFAAHCLDCHGPDEQESGLRLDARHSLLRGGESGEPAIVPGKPAESYLIQIVSGLVDDLVMPPEGDPLEPKHLEMLRQWIADGAKMPQSTQAEVLVTDHWSFQALTDVQPPDLGPGSTDNPIDAFILQKLHAKGLKQSPRADRRTLIRRLYLVMHGLPPTPEQVERFVQNDSPTAWEDLVEEVLDSPRYGERWARHWLDLIRFGETHGFETNRERPNAWPYRDWIIDALNSDKPYDQFVREQIAGDALGEPIGTGFLVAGPHDLVGSPDINLTLMQRQDELTDLINTAGTAFMGLTIGCARCHNHKFDPISQRDFYSVQAVFAGVQHGDRPLPLSERDRERQLELQQAIAQLQEQLQPFLPRAGGEYVMLDDPASPSGAPNTVEHLATPAGTGVNPAGSAAGNVSDPGSAARMPNLSGGRYTWWQNGPGEDVIAYRPSVNGRCRIWISWGAGHSTHTRDARYVIDSDGDLTTRDDQQEIAVIDQQHLAEHQRGQAAETSERGLANQSLWSGLYNAGVHPLSPSAAILVRGGQQGTAITADLVVLEVLPDVASADDEPSRPMFRPPVNARQNVERLNPVEARFVRLTVLATNSSQPCIDELEIFVGQENVALAERGAIASCSSVLPGYEIHKLQHLNDGQYGNGRSWISNEPSSGWVQIELPDTLIIERIEWGRDREGKFADRVATNYRIETSVDGDEWQIVASSADRLPFGSNASQLPGYRFESADPQTAAEARGWVAQLDQLLSEQQRLRQTPTVYAGTFSQPAATHRLYRGDPMAKREEVTPDTLEILGTLELTNDTPEQERRLRFAEWVASPDNPLTARVMMNRVWQFHFGTGIVATPNDFGANGVPPSHPELLDWLANEFVRRGWSLKQMHRLVLLSETWQQDSRPIAAALKQDAGARLLWRFPPRRLEAEAIRDSMLAASGVLDLTMGGPGFSGFEVELENVRHFFPKTSYGPEDFRRMVYMTMVRQERESVFGVFDCPDASQVVARRSRSTTPLQALNLLNSPFTVQQAELLSRRLIDEAGPEPAAQVRRAFELCYGRSAESDEIAQAVAFVNDEGLDQLCRALLNSNEFLFIP